MLLLASVRLIACRDFGDETDKNVGGAGASAAGGAGDRQGEAGTGLTPSRGGGMSGLAGSGAGGAPGGAGEQGGMGGSSASESVGGQPLAGADAGKVEAAGAGGQQGEGSTPADFTGKGLVLWLEASNCTVGATSRVSLCLDQSGAHNDAGQVTPALQPLFVSNALNEHPVLQFDGGDADPLDYVASQLRVEDSASLRLGTSDFSIVVVARWSNDATIDAGVENGSLVFYYSGYGGLLAKTEPTGPYRGISLFANYPLGNAGFPSSRRFAAQLEFGVSFILSYSTNLNDNVYRVYSARRFEHEKLEVRINGNEEGLAQVTPDVNASAVGRPLMIGGGGSAPFRGDIAEMVVINGSISAHDLRGMELNLKAKYDL